MGSSVDSVRALSRQGSTQETVCRSPESCAQPDA
jgi:hypothetical protein